MESSLSFGIVGPGRLGSSLAAALLAGGFRVTAIAGRDSVAATRLATQLERDVAVVADAAAVADVADVVFLTVQDAMVAPAAAAIPLHPRHIAVHCSGALGLDVLASATAMGASVGCLHPLQSFPSRAPDASRFRGITCGIEGDARSAGLLLDLASRVGARAVRLEGVDRALYHAAAVFASNDAVALMSFAARTWELAGLPLQGAREALAPLLLGAARNISTAELPRALTGPVARGDTTTVARHLAALSIDPSLRDIYRRLGAELLRIAELADPAAREGLECLLRDAGDGS